MTTRILSRSCAMFALAGLIWTAACGVASASDLKIGFKAEVTSADPHVLNGANRNIWSHVYDSLVAQDQQLRPKPGLAISWRATSPTIRRPTYLFGGGSDP